MRGCARTHEHDVDLFELTKRLHETYGIDAFFVDEIHFVKDYARYLRLLYDFLPVDRALNDRIPPEYPRQESRFADYLRGGLCPFFLERGA